jgi:hypothetical protein
MLASFAALQNWDSQPIYRNREENDYRWQLDMSGILMSTHDRLLETRTTQKVHAGLQTAS